VILLKRIYLYISLFLIVFGLIISIIPVTAYYFGKYIEYPHHKIEKGSYFYYLINYAILIGSSTTNLGYRFSTFQIYLNITYLGNDEFLVNFTPGPLLRQYIPNLIDTLNYSNYLIKSFVSFNITMNSSYLNLHLFFPDPDLGMPYSLHQGLGKLPSGIYLFTENGIYCTGTPPIYDVNFTLLKFLDNQIAKALVRSGNGTLVINFLETNTAPIERWWDFTVFSISLATPINLILIVAGVGILIYYLRRG